MILTLNVKLEHTLCPYIAGGMPSVVGEKNIMMAGCYGCRATIAQNRERLKKK